MENNRKTGGSIKIVIRGCSSNGRARALHARGTGFDPDMVFKDGISDKTWLTNFT